jgi:hypothetical protein
MALIAQRLADEHPASNEGVTTRFQTFIEDDTGPELVAVFGAMQVATIFVLLIACANVANLLLARATLRTRESAVRTALGASRWRVVMPFFAETLLLSVAGAVAGMVIAYVGITLFDGATQTVGKPYYMRFALDVPVLAFVIGITTMTALVAGAAPAFQVLRTDVNATLKDEARGSSGILGGRVTRALVVAEIALSCALLIGAGLMVKSITRLRNFDFPFATDHVFTARLGLFEIARRARPSSPGSWNASRASRARGRSRSPPACHRARARGGSASKEKRMRASRTIRPPSLSRSPRGSSRPSRSRSRGGGRSRITTPGRGSPSPS